MIAALNGHMTTAQIIIEKGGDPNMTNVCGKTALEIATIRDKREVRGYLDRKTTNKPKTCKSYLQKSYNYANSFRQKGNQYIRTQHFYVLPAIVIYHLQIIQKAKTGEVMRKQNLLNTPVNGILYKI